jgi:hypothetical protein
MRTQLMAYAAGSRAPCSAQTTLSAVPACPCRGKTSGAVICEVYNDASPFKSET